MKCTWPVCGSYSVSRPEQVFFNSSALDDVTADEHAGPEVDHVYEVGHS